MTDTRYLFLLRHATTQAAFGMGDEADRLRALTTAGDAEATSVGVRLGSFGRGDLAILASPARRTQQTAALIVTASGRAASVGTEDALYNADPDTLLDLIRAHVSAGDLMIVGHNPGLYHLVLKLAGDALEEPGFATLTQGYAPATLAVFEVSCDWAALRPSAARLVDILHP